MDSLSTNNQKHWPHVAIAILNYNGKHYLQEYLPSVIACSYPNYSIWVIDNGSTDETNVWLATNYPQIKWIANNANYGFAKGYNLGLQKISADYYLLLNSDITVTPDFMQPVIELMEINPQIAFAQPGIKAIRQPTHFEYAGAAGGCMDMLGYPFCRGRLFDVTEEDTGQYDQNTRIFWASGACLFARPAVFWQLGGFYEFLFMHNEEIDLCWRAHHLGYLTMVCGQSKIYHLGGGSLHANNPKKTFFNFRNNLIICARNMPIGQLGWVFPLRILLDTLASLQFLFSKNKYAAWAVATAWWAFIKWLVVNGANKWPKQRGMRNYAGVFKGSAVWLFFVKKHQRIEL